MDKELLKEILSIPSYTGNELKLVDFICEFLKKNEISYEVDNMLNIYCTKGEADIYPCVVSQTNTEQEYIYNIDVKTEYKNNSNNVLKEAYKGYTRRGKPFRFGFDKAGVFACLTLLLEMPVIKAAFFVSNKIFCIGKIAADPNFFENVGYTIEFDKPHEPLKPNFFFGFNPFSADKSSNSEFSQKVNSVLEDNTIQEYALRVQSFDNAIKSSFDFCGANLSIGYYNYRSSDEYVVLEDVEKGINIGKKMIEKLSFDKYKCPKKEKIKFINWEY
jgi:hypothetical protein